MLVEKYVEHGRHIEVQVIADTHGTVRHLFERDCSTQRRHQKVLEEAPAPTIDDATRERLTSAAVDLAAHVGYVNAGTVEFLLDADTGEVYFLEMNTRLQVEHPVTELVCGGLDLVEHQLRVAAGEPLSIGEVALDGHAIEARVYAEDSFGGFLPQAGTATLRAVARSGVRVDHALESGQVVSTAYDPMLGKVIAHGPRPRERPAGPGRRARRHRDPRPHHQRRLPAGAGRERRVPRRHHRHRLARPARGRAPDPAPARELAAWEVFLGDREGAGPFASDGFRLGTDPAPVVIELDEPVTLSAPPITRAVAAVRHDRVEVVHQGQRFVFDRPDVMADHGAAVGDGTLPSPMPGTVIDVRVEEGQRSRRAHCSACWRR